MFANVQTSRGPAAPAQFYADSQAFKKEVLPITVEEKKLQRDRQIKVERQWAARLEMLTGSPSDDARREAFRALGDCGQAGVASLGRILAESLTCDRKHPPQLASKNLSETERQELWSDFQGSLKHSG